MGLIKLLGRDYDESEKYFKISEELFDRKSEKKLFLIKKSHIDSLLKSITHPQSNFDIYYGYISRSKYFHYDDQEQKDEWQLEVYLHAYALMVKNNFESIGDFGCGSGYKLIKYLGVYETIGYELEESLSFLKNRYTDRRWEVSDFDSDKKIKVDVLICSDVIEHLVNPDLLLEYFLKQDFRFLGF